MAEAKRHLKALASGHSGGITEIVITLKKDDLTVGASITGVTNPTQRQAIALRDLAMVVDLRRKDLEGKEIPAPIPHDAHHPALGPDHGIADCPDYGYYHH